MTKEETIDIFEHNWTRLVNHDYTDEELNKALTMAIEALEQESCGDCISREWIKTAIHNFYHGLIHTPTEEDIQAYLDAAPNVQPKPKTGHWIDTGSGQQCSECGEIQYGYDNYRRYCAYCGAKMESEV